MTMLAVSAMILTSCSTGIESTKKIKMTKEDMKLMSKTPEQEFSSEIRGQHLSEWETGKKFLAMSDRTLYIFLPSGLSNTESGADIEGRIMTYTGIESVLTPGLSEECIIKFSDGIHQLSYATGKPTESALIEIDSSRMPLLADIDLADEWKTKLLDKTLWTRNSLWYDEHGNRLGGRKFEEVKVTDVIPSTGDFPLKVKIKTNKGEEAYLQMNYTSDSHDSRDFSSIFFLTDPKIKYPNISDEHWVLIQQGKVALGMTKDECRLSLGNPDELRSGHNTAQTMDIWQYANGGFLMFTDGLLTQFRL